jgi:hypothetical protein
LQIETLSFELFDLPFEPLVNACAIRIAFPAEMFNALLSFLPRFRSEPAETDACEDINRLSLCDNRRTRRPASSRNRNNEPANKSDARGRHLGKNEQYYAAAHHGGRIDCRGRRPRECRRLRRNLFAQSPRFYRFSRAICISMSRRNAPNATQKPRYTK